MKPGKFLLSAGMLSERIILKWLEFQPWCGGEVLVLLQSEHSKSKGCFDFLNVLIENTTYLHLLSNRSYTDRCILFYAQYIVTCRITVGGNCWKIIAIRYFNNANAKPAVNTHILLTSVRISTVINTIELYFQFNKICEKKKKKNEMNCMTQLSLLNYLNHMWSLLELTNLLFSKEQLGNCLIYKTESNVITNRGAEVILCSQFRNQVSISLFQHLSQ